MEISIVLKCLDSFCITDDGGRRGVFLVLGKRYQLKQLILREVESFRREMRLAAFGSAAASQTSASHSGVGTSSSAHSAWTSSSACSSSTTRFGGRTQQARDMAEDVDEGADENMPPAVPVPPLPKTSAEAAAAAAAAAVTRQRYGRKVRPAEQPPHYRSSKLRPRGRVDRFTSQPLIQPMICY